MTEEKDEDFQNEAAESWETTGGPGGCADDFQEEAGGLEPEDFQPEAETADQEDFLAEQAEDEEAELQDPQACAEESRYEETGAEAPVNEKPEATNAREKEQAEEPSEELVEKPAEQPDGEPAEESPGEPAEESAEEYSAGQSAELKMVLHVEGGRASAAVWRSGADPHIETFPETGALEDLIGELPGWSSGPTPAGPKAP